MTETTEEELCGSIARRAARLRRTPADLATWHHLARTLLEAEKDAAASKVFLALGCAANRLAQVALAVACAQQLRDLGAEDEAEDLVSAIAKLHCRGSKAIDPKRKHTPLAPPPAGDSAQDEMLANLTLEAAVESALAAADYAKGEIEKRSGSGLPATPLVGVLARDELRELALVVRHRLVDEGTVVIEIGEPATSLFWVASGALEVTRGEHVLGELRSNAFFGEIALVGATDRTAQVTATTDSWLLDIPSESLEKLAGRSPRLARVLANHARARILSNVMRTSGLFSSLSDDERRSLLPRFEPRILDDGERLIEGGGANDSLYVVASGTVEVRSGEELIATLSVGEGVGEQSLLSRKPAMCDVVSKGRTVVLGLERSHFDDLVLAHPGLLTEAYRLLVEREKQGRDKVVHDASTLVI